MRKWFRRRRQRIRPIRVRHITIDGQDIRIYSYPADDKNLGRLMGDPPAYDEYNPDYRQYDAVN
jgi:hypothetical protein